MPIATELFDLRFKVPAGKLQKDIEIQYLHRV